MAGGVCLTALPGFAQDALRLATDAQQVYTDLQREAREVTQRQEGNVRLGPVDMVFGLSLAVGYNDNINLSRSDTEGSFIINPGGSASVFWQATETSSLAVSVGVGYAKYIDHPDNDQFTVAPTSAISYTMFIGGVRLRIYDNISYSLNPVDVGTVSGTSEYGGVQNNFGIASDWEFSKAILTVGYSHYNFISTVESSDPQQNTMDSVFARMPFEVNPAVSIGPEVSWGYTRFVDQLRNDNQNVSAGAFGQWQPTDQLSFEARVGYAYYFFQSSSAFPAPPNTGSVYGTLNARQVITETISHALSFSHQIQSGYESANADATETTQLNYQISLAIVKDLTLGLGAGFSHGEDIGGVQPETYNQLLLSFGTAYQLTKKMTVGFSYQFAKKVSDSSDDNYSQNSGWLTFGYTF